MKIFSLKSITLLSILYLIVFINSCEKNIVNESINPIDPLPILYQNDGPLATVTSFCEVLSFTDEAHFESVYQYLDTRYTANESQDSTASLDAFQKGFNYTSRRNFIDDWEEDMENQGIPIDNTNDVDTIFFGDLVMQTLINEKGIVKIGDDAVLMLDECLWIRLSFNDCQGKSLLEDLFAILHSAEPNVDELISQFIIEHNVQFEDRCPTFLGARSTGCGFRTDFEYDQPTLNPSNNRFEFTLKDLTVDYLTNSQVRIWSIVNNDQNNPALFVLPLGVTDIRDFRKNPKISVPSWMDHITIRLAKRTLIPYCVEFVEKTIYFNCPYPDWNYINEYEVKFYTRNAQPGTQVNWNFGDGNNSSSFSPSHVYSTSCPEVFDVNFSLPSADPNCPQEYSFPVKAGPAGFLRHKRANDWYESGSEKFKWRIVANGAPNILGLSVGNSKVRGFIKYKRKNNNGKWRKRRTSLKIQFMGNTYDNLSCSILNDLSAITSAKSKNNKKRMWHKYTTSTPFFISVNDPIKAYFEAGGISGTFDVFD